ncbi:armadillo repeat-containing protein 1-like [Alligator mississippiensis]|uniref:Armadillo repeat-containing protein 1 n=1 Tax=Alligator mississippiensis TaxID=8496 RepID=A0A151M3F4_ALLMI|nr:armadillo repeat-containing protein 1-like [Alligator mississippiensis]
MDALSVANQLRHLSSDPGNRETIVKDEGCLSGLILFLDHPNTEVVYLALQALQYLSECPSNCEIVTKEPDIMWKLEKLQKRHDTNGSLQLLAREVQNALNTCFYISNTQRLDNVHTKNLCEEALLKVKGVISFTFQSALRRCTVRVKSDLETETLASAIAATKVSEAQLRSESGKEIIVPLKTASVLQQSHLPEYLPEEESLHEESEKAVLQTGTKTDAKSSWINSATHFLTKAFYWRLISQQKLFKTFLIV